MGDKTFTKMIKLTEKQKKALIDLNTAKTKIEQDHALIQERIKDVIDFIFDANGIDSSDIQEVALKEDHLIFKKKAQDAAQVVEAEEVKGDA